MVLCSSFPSTTNSSQRSPTSSFPHTPSTISNGPHLQTLLPNVHKILTSFLKPFESSLPIAQGDKIAQHTKRTQQHSNTKRQRSNRGGEGARPRGRRCCWVVDGRRRRGRGGGAGGVANDQDRERKEVGCSVLMSMKEKGRSGVICEADRGIWRREAALRSRRGVDREWVAGIWPEELNVEDGFVDLEI